MSVRTLTSGRPLITSTTKSRGGSRALIAFGVLAVSAAALFLWLVEQVMDHQGLTRSDRWLLGDIISLRTGALTALAKVVTNLGTAGAYLLLAGVGYWYWHKKRSVLLPVATLAWMAIGLILRLAISQAISRPRPSPVLRLVSSSGFAFPSGHTATATIGFGLMALILWGITGRKWRILTNAAAVLAALAVGLSRSYLGVHWPTDVLGGWSFGLAWVALGAFLWPIAMWCVPSRRCVETLSAGQLKDGNS